MRRCFLLAAVLMLLSPQILFSFTRTFDDCCGRQLGLRGSMVVSAWLGYVDVNVSVAKQMIESDPNLTILDVRTQSEYDSGHIQNATLIPSDQLASRLSELDKQKDILVYCASGGRSATASQTLVDNGFLHVYNMLGGITAWKNAGYWIEIIHNRDLIIDGTQTFVIENCIYIQKANILVTDEASLIIRNATLELEQIHGWQHEILVTDHANLTIEESTLDSIFGFPVELGGQSTAFVRDLATGHYSSIGFSCSENSNVEIIDSKWPSVSIRDNCSVTIANSNIRAIELHLTSGIFRLKNLQPGFIEYWDLHQNQTVGNISQNLRLEESWIDDWNVDAYDSNGVSLIDSTVGNVVVKFVNASLDIDKIQPGYIQNKTLGPIQIENSTIGHWRLTFQKHSLCAVANSTADIECTYSETSDSTVSLKNWSGCLNLWYYIGEVVLNNVNCYEVAAIYSDVFIQGNLMLESTSIPWWVSSNITRNYGMVLQEKNGSSVADVELTLHSQNNTVVWNGFSDSTGEVNFNLTFTDSNYTDSLRLEASKEDLFATKVIAFLSDTPVTLVMMTTATADINNDGSVDIYDAILLANSYNSILSSLNWNSKADLNSDNIVDIYDAIILANNFNKHYP